MGRRCRLTRTIGRRLELSEVRAEQIAAVTQELHALRFIDADTMAVSMFEMGTGKWMDFDPAAGPGGIRADSINGKGPKVPSDIYE